jgi:hypothetical protein
MSSNIQKNTISLRSLRYGAYGASWIGYHIYLERLVPAIVWACSENEITQGVDF